MDHSIKKSKEQVGCRQTIVGYWLIAFIISRPCSVMYLLPENTLLLLRIDRPDA